MNALQGSVRKGVLWNIEKRDINSLSWLKVSVRLKKKHLRRSPAGSLILLIFVRLCFRSHGSSQLKGLDIFFVS